MRRRGYTAERYIEDAAVALVIWLDESGVDHAEGLDVAERLGEAVVAAADERRYAPGAGFAA
jgi:hypothetical protein